MKILEKEKEIENFQSLLKSEESDDIIFNDNNQKNKNDNDIKNIIVKSNLNDIYNFDENEEYNLKPSKIEDILKLESPFYKLNRISLLNYKKSIISKNYKKSSLLSSKYIEETYNIKKNNNLNNKNNDIDNNNSNISNNFYHNKNSFNSDFNDNISLYTINFDAPLFEINIFNSIYMTILQIINCIIKYPLVQIAYCMKVLGLVWGSFTIIFISMCSLISLHLLLKVHKKTNERNYLIFSEMLFGKYGKFIILILNFFSAYGSCWSYVIIFLKVIPNLITLSFGPTNIKDSNVYITFTLGIILYTYCHHQDVTGIKKAAFYGFMGIISFFIITVLDFLYSTYKGDKLNDYLIDKFLFSQRNFFEKIYEINNAVSILILCFTFHIFTFSIYGCMGDINVHQFYQTAYVSVLISTFIYLICGICGYLLYSDNLEDSVLDAIGKTSLSVLLSLCNVENVIMTFPITFSALKNYFLFILEVFLTKSRDLFLYIFSCFDVVKRKKIKLINSEKIDKKKFLNSSNSVTLPKFIENVLVLTLFISILVLANTYQSLKNIFSVLGGIMGNLLSFIFPAAFYLFLVGNEGSVINLIFSIFFIFFGMFTMILCITSTILNILGKK